MWLSGDSSHYNVADAYKYDHAIDVKAVTYREKVYTDRDEYKRQQLIWKKKSYP